MAVFQMMIVIATFIIGIMAAFRKVPPYMMKVFWINFFICFAGWEFRMSVGSDGADSISSRNSAIQSSLFNSLIMSAGDGLIGVLQVVAAKKVAGTEAFKKWDWKAFGIMLSIGVIQNIAIGVLLRKQVARGVIAWSPLMPFPGPNWWMNQQPWIIQPFILYPLLIHYNKSVFKDECAQ